MIVVKFGGHAMKDENGNFSKAIKSVVDAGIDVVVVHGGGPQIDAALSEAGIESSFVGGFRVTTPQIFAIVERVLTQDVASVVVAHLSAAGIKAKAISGRTNGTLVAKKLTNLVDGTKVDLGLVGEISAVDTKEVLALLKDKCVPVISPIASNAEGTQGFNVNADLAAAALAGALGAQFLIIMTDVAGIYRDWPDQGSLIDQISANELEKIKGDFAQGMAPKVKACLDAIEYGAKAVRIIDGTNPNSFSEALHGRGGTLVTV